MSKLNDRVTFLFTPWFVVINLPNSALPCTHSCLPDASSVWLKPVHGNVSPFRHDSASFNALTSWFYNMVSGSLGVITTAVDFVKVNQLDKVYQDSPLLFSGNDAWAVRGLYLRYSVMKVGSEIFVAVGRAAGSKQVILLWDEKSLRKPTFAWVFKMWSWWWRQKLPVFPSAPANPHHVLCISISSPLMGPDVTTSCKIPSPQAPK